MVECVAKGFGTDMGMGRVCHGSGMGERLEGLYWTWGRTSACMMKSSDVCRLGYLVSCTQELATPAPHLHPVCIRTYPGKINGRQSNPQCNPVIKR